MQILIEIDEDTYNDIKKGKIYSSFRDVPLESVNAIANGTPLDEKELKLKRWIEKDIEMLNEIIESGWLISDLEKCPAIDACEDAITALKQYPVLDKVRAEIESIEHYGTNNGHDFWLRTPDEIKKDVLTIIDKYRGNVDEI